MDCRGHSLGTVKKTDAEVTRAAARIHRRVVKLLERRDLRPQSDPQEADTLSHAQPLLADLYSASVTGRVATGPRTGQRLMKVGDKVHGENPAALSGPRCTTISGFSLHANVAVAAHDRMGLERLARYAGSPPLATERLSRLPNGRLLYRLKRRWPDGTSHMIFEPLDFVAKLAALVPPPRFNSVRYHGGAGPFRRLETPCCSFRSRIHPPAAALPVRCRKARHRSRATADN